MESLKSDSTKPATFGNTLGDVLFRPMANPLQLLFHARNAVRHVPQGMSNG